MPQPWQAIAQRFCSIPIYRVINGSAFQEGRYFYNPGAFSVRIDRIRDKGKSGVFGEQEAAEKGGQDI